MARIGKGQAFTSNDFKKAIYAIRGNNRQTKGMACSVAIEGQNEGSVLLVTDTWKGPEPITGCRLHRYSRKKQHFEDYRLKPISITVRGNFSLVLCDFACDGKGSFEIKSLHKKCLSGQQLKRDFRVYTIYRDECKVLELIYNDGSYKLIDNGLYDLTLCGSPIIDEDNFKKYLVGVLTTNAEGKVIPCFLSNGVLEEPAFTTHPKNHQTLREGVNITFSSDAHGIPEPTFTWTKDGSAVTANDRISVSADNKKLSLTNVNRADSGEYRCVATNSVGTVNSNAATLTSRTTLMLSINAVTVSMMSNISESHLPLKGLVSLVNTYSNWLAKFCFVGAFSHSFLMTDQPEFTAHPQSQTLVEGSSVTFSSDANGVTEPIFSWTKDGSSVTADNRISLSADNKQLSLTNANRTDSGEYRCLAANSVGTVNSNAATLTVLFPPEFTAHPHSQTSMQGSSVTFSSDANGIPEPTFSWSKDGSAVTSDNRISLSVDNKQLSITNVNRTDSGEYRCVAANSVGTVYSNASTLTL
ncbi:unnamed protein product, partial [Porites evermanni]